MPTVEHRTLAVAPTTPVAQPDAQLQEGEFLAKAVVYGVVDTYGTDFAPGVFNQSLSSDPLPPVLWSHNSQQSPTNVLGRLVDWHDSLSALLVVGQLDQANPHYDLMRGQLQSKTICRRVGRLRPPGGPAVRNQHRGHHHRPGRTLRAVAGRGAVRARCRGHGRPRCAAAADPVAPRRRGRRAGRARHSPHSLNSWAVFDCIRRRLYEAAC